MDARSPCSDTQGRGRWRGRTNRGRIRGQPGGQPPEPPRPRQIRHVRGAAPATSAHPQGWLAERDAPARDTHVRGQDPPARAADGAGTGVRDGLSGRLARVSTRTRCTRSLAVTVATRDEYGRGLDRGCRSAKIFRHDRPWSSTGIPKPSGTRGWTPATVLKMPEAVCTRR